jgi:hypothetical protein
MANVTKETFLGELRKRYGKIHRLDTSLSLYDIGNGAGRVYIRYSKVHTRGQTFYGLRRQDLQQLEGHPAILCLLWPEQEDPLLLPYSDFEDVSHSVAPANDGQYKVQLFFQDAGTDLYIANAGRFNVEAYWGWEQLDSIIDKSKITDYPELSHVQIQTLLGSIGIVKGYDIWIPKNDRNKLDWDLTKQFICNAEIPSEYHRIEDILTEIDVIWIERGAGKLRALFEVEHSTPIYSGLLRFNDVHLMYHNSMATFSIVSNDDRRALFVRQLSRPTFTFSKLAENCNFLEYQNVFLWHRRIQRQL